MSNNYRPVLKWTGSKYNEYKFIKPYLPDDINDYYEPFAGGMGLMYHLKEDNLINGQIYANDVSQQLIDFYHEITNDAFFDKLQKISDVWDAIREIGNNILEKYESKMVEAFDKGDITVFINDELKNNIESLINKKESLKNFNFHDFSLKDIIIDGLTDKVKRFVRKKDKFVGNKNDYIKKAIPTSICQSFYFIVREMYNDWLNPLTVDKYGDEEKAAQWYFIRQFAFGGMFRFGKDGKFNIPYGGYGYNDRCFTCYIDHLKSDEIQDIFKKINLSCMDFEDILKKDFNENDFIFLDPPYDSTFNNYESGGFNHHEQERLKNALSNLKTKWMVVIKETDFIKNLYRDFNFDIYDKTYQYNARGDYDKKVQHLIIRNYH